MTSVSSKRSLGTLCSSGALFAAALFGSSSSLAQSLRPDYVFRGLGRAKDGDSLVVGSREVRLFGIDAPEFDQTCRRTGGSWACGSEAAGRLAQLVTGRDVRCVRVSIDQYQRAVSRCTVGTTDINRAMVESGYATAYRRYSDDYVAAEGFAKAAKRGLWSGTFEAPRDYRVEHRPFDRANRERGVRPAARTPVKSSDWAARSQCRIKGNQNRRGSGSITFPACPTTIRLVPDKSSAPKPKHRLWGIEGRSVRTRLA